MQRLTVDEIYNKWYVNKFKREIFDKVVTLDPLTVVKNKEVVKLGRYCRWLLKVLIDFQKDKDGKYLERFVFDEAERIKIHDAFVLFHNWYRINTHKIECRDIFSFKSLANFQYGMERKKEDYDNIRKARKNKGHIFIIYEDENIMVLEPLDFIACFRFSRHTEWCSKSENAYNSWKRDNILLRFVDKKNKIIHRLTWSYANNDSWSWATPIYPEFNRRDFSKENATPLEISKFDYKIDPERYANRKMYEEEQVKILQIEKMHQLINQSCIDNLMAHYLKRKAEHEQWVLEENKRYEKEQLEKSMSQEFVAQTAMYNYFNW